MRSIFLLVLLSALLVSSTAIAQGVGAPTGQKTLAAAMNVYVFPDRGQNSSQQSMDEADCYNWAVGNIGTDPFELSKQANQQASQAAQQKQAVQQAGEGAGARGAVGGAAGGALIGAIAGDAGKGAAYGAAAGLIAGRRARRRAQGEVTQQIDQQTQQTQQATADQIENFKKAFSVCLEAKDYLVKY